jgi:hypothetical protein
MVQAHQSRGLRTEAQRLVYAKSWAEELLKYYGDDGKIEASAVEKFIDELSESSASSPTKLQKWNSLVAFLYYCQVQKASLKDFIKNLLGIGYYDARARLVKAHMEKGLQHAEDIHDIDSYKKILNNVILLLEEPHLHDI